MARRRHYIFDPAVILYAMHSYGITQRALSAESGIAESTLSTMLHRNNYVGKERGTRLMRALRTLVQAAQQEQEAQQAEWQHLTSMLNRVDLAAPPVASAPDTTRL